MPPVIDFEPEKTETIDFTPEIGFEPESSQPNAPSLVLSPEEQHKQLYGVRPESGMEAGTEFTRAIAPGAIALTKLPGQVLQKVMHPIEVGAAALFNQSKIATAPQTALVNGTGVLDVEPISKPGEPMLNLPVADDPGVLGAISRFAESMSTPGNIVTLPAAITSKPLQGALAATMAAGIPETLQNVDNDPSGSLTEAALQAVMAGALGRGAMKKTPAKELPMDSSSTEPFNIGATADSIAPIAPMTSEALRAVPKTEASSATDLVSKPKEPDLTTEGDVVPDTTTAFDPSQVRTVEVPLDKLKLSKDVPNFKAGADEGTGVVSGQRLEGKFVRTGTAPIVVWERLSGDMEIITGRHRHDLAVRSGEKTIPAQIVRESEGFTKDQALTLDAESNIRDGQGSVEDYATYFKNTNISEAEARSRGLLSRTKGEAGWHLAKNASPDLYALYRSGKVTPEQAAAIARAAPGNVELQQVVSKSAISGEPPAVLSNLVRAYELETRGSSPKALDLFGSDDAAIKQMEERAKRATLFQRQIGERIRAIQSSAKRPELAKAEGVDIKDPAAVLNRVRELKSEAERWQNWAQHPDLVEKVKMGNSDFSLSKAESVEEQQARVEREKTSAQEKAEAKRVLEELSVRSQARLSGNLGEAGQGGLFSETGQQEIFKPPSAEAMTGMGGAVPQEFELSPKTATSIKNARVDSERQLRGLPPAVQSARRSFGEVWDTAMAKIDNDPGYPDRLINELRDTPRALTDAEDATLLHRQIDLQNEYGKATRDLAQAFEDGRKDDVGHEQARVAAISDQLLDIYNVGKKVGTETGRGLNARKMMAYEDFTLAKMEMDKRSVNEGRPLTPEERAEVTKLQNRIESTQKAYDEYVSKTGQRISELEATRAIEEASSSAIKEPVVEPHVKLLADRIKDYFDKRADAALKRLSGKVFTLSPQVLADLTDLGVSRILQGSIEFGQWSVKMVEALGERIKPHLQTVFEASQAALDDHVSKVSGAKSEKVKRAAKGMDIAEQSQVAKDTIKERVAGGKRSEISAQVQKLARIFVEQGVKGRDALIDAVHGVLKDIDPTFTRREAMDAISGYGDFKQLSKDDISVQLRDLKGQMQQVGKLEDMQAGQAPQKTGVERRAPSDEERRLIKQVDEAKKKGGYVVTDPATQLRSSLQSIKTRLENQISDLQHEISTKERIVRGKTDQPTSPEIEALKTKRDALKEERDSLLGSRELTDAQRIKMATASVEKSIAEYEQRIASKDISPLTSPSKTPSTPALESLRSKRDALKEQLQELRDLANPKKTPEERALQSLKTRLANQIETLQDKLARGDFSTKPKRIVQMDAEANRLHFEATKAKISWHEALMKDRLANRSIPKKVLDTGVEVLNTSRAILTSMDLSAVLRQGGFIALAHPIRAAKAFPAMLRALRSEEGQHAVNMEIAARKNFPLYNQSKLYLSEHGQKLSQMEEAYMSRWADKIPIVAGSQRAYVTFLNKLRADSFDAMANSLARTSELTPVEAKAIANFVNVATGRGNFGMKDNALVGLNTVFFAPRYVASRFQLLVGQPLYVGTARTRSLIAAEYARYLAGIAIVYGLATLDGAEIEQDPRSSDFGKLRYGDTRIDPLSGLAQVTVLMSRLATGETKTLKGKIVPIRGAEVPFGSGNSADVMARFLRTKLAPVPGQIVNILSGKDVVGQPVTSESVAEGLLVPLAFQDIYNAMIEQGIPRGTAFAILSLFGFGLQTYEERKK